MFRTTCNNFIESLKQSGEDESKLERDLRTALCEALKAMMDDKSLPAEDQKATLLGNLAEAYYALSLSGKSYPLQNQIEQAIRNYLIDEEAVTVEHLLMAGLDEASLFRAVLRSYANIVKKDELKVKYSTLADRFDDLSGALPTSLRSKMPKRVSEICAMQARIHEALQAQRSTPSMG